VRNKLLRILPDIIAICAFAGLAAWGKLGVETACGFILAVCSGRLYPRRKIGAGRDDPPDSEPPTPRPTMKTKPDHQPAKKPADDDDDDVPSGVATILFFVLSLGEIIADLFHHRSGA